MGVKKIILIVSVKDFDRANLEGIENGTFTFDELQKKLFEMHNEKRDFSLHELADFVDLVNNEEFNEVDSWITHINLRKDNLRDLTIKNKTTHKYYCEVCQSAWAETDTEVSYPHYACTMCRENDPKITYENSIEFNSASDYGND